MLLAYIRAGDSDVCLSQLTMNHLRFFLDVAVSRRVSSFLFPWRDFHFQLFIYRIFLRTYECYVLAAFEKARTVLVRKMRGMYSVGTYDTYRYIRNSACV